LALFDYDSDRSARHPCPVQHRPRDAELGGCPADAEVCGAVEVWLGDVEGFCPRRCPLAFARASPARTRSAMRARSNSARAARTWSCKRPAGVVQSIPSPSDTKLTPRVLVEQRHEEDRRIRARTPATQFGRAQPVSQNRIFLGQQVQGAKVADPGAFPEGESQRFLGQTDDFGGPATRRLGGFWDTLNRRPRWRGSRRARRPCGSGCRRRPSAGGCAKNVRQRRRTFAPECSGFSLAAGPSGLRQNHSFLEQLATTSAHPAPGRPMGRVGGPICSIRAP